VFVMVLLIWGFMQATMMYEQEARFDWEKDDTLTYLRERCVSNKMQARVLRQLDETSRARSMKRKFDNFSSNDVPMELQRQICEELWGSRLNSLGLIRHLTQLETTFASDLSLRVREETLAGKSRLFVEGDESLAAYCIVLGQLAVSSSRHTSDITDFTGGMWVGEKALVCPYLPRTVTVTTQVTSTLMAVPADAFRNLLLDFGLLKEFEDFCAQILDLGVCGRCGDVGSHFANECSLLDAGGSSHGAANWLSSCRWMEETCRDCIAAQTWMCNNQRMGSLALGSDYLPLLCPKNESAPASGLSQGSVSMAKRELRRFLRARRLKALLPGLESRGIMGLEDLSRMEPGKLFQLTQQLAEEVGDVFGEGDSNGKRVQAMLHKTLNLTPKAIQEFRDGGPSTTSGTRPMGAVSLLGVREQHLLFLSHCKAEAGTEAALLRTELEGLIEQHVALRHLTFEVPVFLDSEDLTNLETLQEHVRNSHNLVLLLTKCVLVRPWCIVEIVTAVNHGIPVLPVQVMKAGGEFKFPDEEFYTDLPEQLGKGGIRVLKACEISVDDAQEAIKKVFQRISISYSPHRAAAARQPELEAILKECPARSNRTLTAFNNKLQRPGSPTVSGPPAACQTPMVIRTASTSQTPIFRRTRSSTTLHS